MSLVTRLCQAGLLPGLAARPRRSLDHRPALALGGTGLGASGQRLADLGRSQPAFSPGFLPTAVRSTSLLAPPGTHAPQPGRARYRFPGDSGISRAGKIISTDKGSWHPPLLPAREV